MNQTRISTVIEKMFYIQTKEGRKVPFILNPAQRFFVQNRTDRTLIAKARQFGFSSYIVGEFAVRCLGIEGTRAAVMSHEAGSTQRLLDRASYYMKHIKGPRPQFGRHSRNEFHFSKMDTTFYIGTAGSRAFGRGDTVTDLHCSEYAWWEHPEIHHGGVFQAVPKTGRIVIESTGNGRVNDFYFMWKNADRMGYTRLFYPWHAGDEYRLNVGTWKPDTPGFNHVMLEMQDKHGISHQKMAWWEMKFRELRENLKLMNQEYPTEPEDCFQATGGAVFPNVEIHQNDLWVEEKMFGYYLSRLLGHPRPNFNYVIGGDPSGGTGNDDAALQVMCCETGEQILAFANNNCQPIQFAELICQIGTLFNNAYAVVEGNNHGIAVVEYLKSNYNRGRIYKRKPGTASAPPQYGWLNSKQTKHALIDMMQEDLSNVTLYDHQTGSELQAFEEVETGKFQGVSDNLVIAVGLALIGLQRYAHLRGKHLIVPEVEEKPILGWHYTLDSIMDDIKGRRYDVNYFGYEKGRLH